MSQDETAAPRARRERSARYPGVPLAEAVEFARTLDRRGLDGLPAGAIAEGLGYASLKTNTFSARLSAARQFGLLERKGDADHLTALARSILHPIDEAQVPALFRQALGRPPLYAELAGRFAGRRLPEPPALANLLYHHHQITAAAKQVAAEAFLESARSAGAVDADGLFHPAGPEGDGPPAATPPHADAPAPARLRPKAARGGVRVDVRLWGPDSGKVIRLRAPEVIAPESFERFLQAFRLLVRVEEPPAD